jgi:hypothetical protein
LPALAIGVPLVSLEPSRSPPSRPREVEADTVSAVTVFAGRAQRSPPSEFRGATPSVRNSQQAAEARSAGVACEAPTVAVPVASSGASCESSCSLALCEVEDPALCAVLEDLRDLEQAGMQVIWPRRPA